jgi:hypothetical protein
MISKSDLSLDLLKETINKIAANQKKTINIPYIQEVVCEYFGLKENNCFLKPEKEKLHYQDNWRCILQKNIPMLLLQKLVKKWAEKTFYGNVRLRNH